MKLVGGILDQTSSGEKRKPDVLEMEEGQEEESPETKRARLDEAENTLPFGIYEPHTGLVHCMYHNRQASSSPCIRLIHLKTFQEGLCDVPPTHDRRWTGKAIDIHLHLMHGTFVNVRMSYPQTVTATDSMTLLCACLPTTVHTGLTGPQIV